MVFPQTWPGTSTKTASNGHPSNCVSIIRQKSVAFAETAAGYCHCLTLQLDTVTASHCSRILSLPRTAAGYCHCLRCSRILSLPRAAAGYCHCLHCSQIMSLPRTAAGYCHSLPLQLDTVTPSHCSRILSPTHTAAGYCHPLTLQPDTVTHSHCSRIHSRPRAAAGYCHARTLQPDTVTASHCSRILSLPHTAARHLPEGAEALHLEPERCRTPQGAAMANSDYQGKIEETRRKTCSSAISSICSDPEPASGPAQWRLRLTA
jgi:hypothetical protein